MQQLEVLTAEAIMAIEKAVKTGYCAEVKMEKGAVTVVKKREKRTVTYRGSAES